MRYPYLDFQIKAVMAKDSLHITDHDRKIIYQVIKDHESEDASMVILHGTDTVDQTLQYCYEQEQQAKKKISVPVVFTGSMTPLGFVDSDAFQNVVEAIQASQLLEPGFYLSFHGQVFIPPMLQKNREKRTFEKKLRLALTSKDKEKATELLSAYTSKASKAAKKGVMKAETVSRKVSRLSKSLFSLNS